MTVISHINTCYVDLVYLFFFSKCQGRCSDTSTAESGSDADDLGSPIGARGVGFSRLAPVHEEVSYACYSFG